MIKLNNEMKIAGELACRSLSNKAFKVYAGTDPLNVYEYEENGEERYAITGCLGENEGMTFGELGELLEGYAELETLIF